MTLSTLESLEVISTTADISRAHILYKLNVLFAEINIAHVTYNSNNYKEMY